MTLANPMQFICWKILHLMIAGIHEIYIKEINIKKRVYNYYFDKLVKEKKLETKNMLIDEKNYKDLVIYFTKYVCRKSIKMLSLHYYEFMGKIEVLI